jgi:hypothetical protein
MAAQGQLLPAVPPELLNCFIQIILQGIDLAG